TGQLAGEQRPAKFREALTGVVLDAVRNRRDAVPEGVLDGEARAIVEVDPYSAAPLGSAAIAHRAQGGTIGNAEVLADGRIVRLRQQAGEIAAAELAEATSAEAREAFGELRQGERLGRRGAQQVHSAGDPGEELRDRYVPSREQAPQPDRDVEDTPAALEAGQRR